MAKLALPRKHYKAETAAALAYNSAALKYFGCNAQLNEVC